MQDPNEDTEWNDVLRAKGIIPDKPKENEINEEEIIAMMEKTIKQKSGGKKWSHLIFTRSFVCQNIQCCCYCYFGCIKKAIIAIIILIMTLYLSLIYLKLILMKYQ